MAVLNSPAQLVETHEKNAEIETKDVLAMRRAFLTYDDDEKVRLLVVMPMSEAIAILNTCPLAKVRRLLDRMMEKDHDVRSRQLATGLGLISSEAEPDGNYLTNGVWVHVRERIGWIVGLALLGIVSGLIISHYEDTLSQLVLLAVYMPVIAAAGGNAGSQAATLVVRALAMGEIHLTQWLAVVWKEFRIALVIAVALSVVIMGRVVLFSGHQILPDGMTIYSIAMAIGVALVIQVVISTTIGGLLPMIARACKLDPAVLVSPVLASVVDISGMMIYFITVNAMLGLN
ncbi:magnesium transporter [Parasalinivibrio latis]|uniref:magnesium transporter n=1 Tax=Parasalinivibrio latis TaxID=2952610 RepID=UPI0030DE8907